MRVAATVAVSALSLALVTGCGGGSVDSKESKESDGQATTAAKALSAAELEKLVLAKGDVDGYTVGSTLDNERFAASKDKLTVTDTACEPVAHVVTGFVPGDSATDTSRRVTEEKKPTDTASKALEDLSEEEFEEAFGDALSVDLTLVSLSSYEGDGATATMKSLSEAVDGCAGGFTVKSGKEEAEYSKVASEDASGAGDESVAFAVTGEENSVVHGAVVRHGNTIATYYTVNMGKATTGGKYTVPAAVIDAQAAKLK
ncbi:hypothetical protein AQJ91_07430 [Streptomyces dysideae]|uniref:Lipoprotein n=1 Tax=Streptomyces dysideae TaxID=909626 RepID=A0A117S2A0_9ACTN|nr:hypothetical protein AQJ91_07430 [Streptomyces dysideae]